MNFHVTKRRRRYDAEARAQAKAQKRWRVQQETLARECGKTRCELCEKVSPLVTWDEREHGWGKHEKRSRQPIWRICSGCRTKALAARRDVT